MPSTAATYDVAALRAVEFPWMEEHRVFLNAASFGPLPDRSRRALEAFNRRRHEADRMRPHDLLDALTTARRLAARLVGAEPAEIALAPNTTWGLDIAAEIVEARSAAERRTIVVSDGEFPANMYPWMALERRGMRLERVAADPLGRPREDALARRIRGGDVAAFAVSGVQFATGHRADLERFGRLCREHGALFVVDGIQGLGAMPIDVRAARIDVLASGGQKWLCSPFGTGFAYVRAELANRYSPRLPGWMAFTASADFSRLLDYEYELLPDARRFEPGTVGYQDFEGFNASVGLLLELGVDAIWAHIQRVLAPLLRWAAGRDDVTLVSPARPPNHSPIACLRLRRPEAAHAALADAGIVCAVREGVLRIAPHFYSTVAEMERVVEVLDGGPGA